MAHEITAKCDEPYQKGQEQRRPDVQPQSRAVAASDKGKRRSCCAASANKSPYHASLLLEELTFFGGVGVHVVGSRVVANYL